MLEIVIFNLDFDASVRRKVRPIKAVGRVGFVITRDEPFRMLDDPRRVDAHVVRHHVACQAHAVAVRTVAQIDIGRFAAEIVRDSVVVERIS